MTTTILTDPNKARNTRIRIDFVVREVCDDGSVPEDELRFVRFGDDVDRSDVAGFFDRTRLALAFLFPPEGDLIVAWLKEVPHKIALCKELRVLSCCSLKDAKDAIERPLGSDSIVVPEAMRSKFIDGMGFLGLTAPADFSLRHLIGRSPDRGCLNLGTGRCT